MVQERKKERERVSVIRIIRGIDVLLHVQKEDEEPESFEGFVEVERSDLMDVDP